jgi:site-specific DNA recombinase
VCGAGFIMAGRNRLACFGAREKGTCSNRLTIRRDEVEARVLKAPQDKLLNQELFEEFCDEFTRELNRLRMEHRASFSAAEHEIERIEVRRKKADRDGDERRRAVGSARRDKCERRSA